jgi:hypothetical protein
VGGSWPLHHCAPRLAIIGAARTRLPGPDLSVQPVWAFVARICTAEVEHAEADFWWVVRRLNAAGLFAAAALAPGGA